MLDQWLNSLPRGVLVLGGLLVGLFFIVKARPPHTACQSQSEVIHQSQTPFLFLDEKKPYMTTTGFKKTHEMCRLANSPGGCLELFEGLKKLLGDLEASSVECLAEVASEESIIASLWKGGDMIVRLAWGSNGPPSVMDKMAWLDSTHVNLFCKLKKMIIAASGEDDWTSYREQMLQTLPKAREMGRDEAWKRSLLSVSCNQ